MCLSTLKHDGILVFRRSSQFFFTCRGRKRLEQLYVAFTWPNGSLCIHAISFCTILMTEWICWWYNPFWIRRGESFHKGDPEEWEQVDVAQSYASGEDQSCPTATATKTEGIQKTQEDERTSTRELNRSRCSLPKSSWEAVGTFDAPSWKYTGTQENTVSWRSLGFQPPSNARARHFYPSKAIWRFSQKVSPTVPL